MSWWSRRGLGCGRIGGRSLWRMRMWRGIWCRGCRFSFFSIRNCEDKKKSWCQFVDAERDNYTEKIWQDYKRDKIDNQPDADNTRIINWQNCKQMLPPAWCWDNNKKWKFYSPEHSKIIDEAFLKNKETLNLDIDGRPYTINLKLKKQYPVGRPNNSRTITRKTEDSFRKILRVEIGWFWLEDEEKGIWKTYSSENTRIIEEAYTSNQAYAWIVVNSNNSETRYKINLVMMLQCNLVKPKENLRGPAKKYEHLWIRKVCRVGPHFPRELIDYPDVTIDPREVPDYWTEDQDVIAPTPGSDTKFHEVSRSSPEWNMIERFMRRGFIPNHDTIAGWVAGSSKSPSSFEVLKVIRVQSRILWLEYQYRKISLLKSSKVDPEFNRLLAEKPFLLGDEAILDKTANEYYMYHGTKKANIIKIAETGFTNRHIMDIISTNPYNGMFGCGVYYSENSSKSNQYVDCPCCGHGAVLPNTENAISQPCECTPEEVQRKGGYVMILSRVLMGNPHICSEYLPGTYKSLHAPPYGDSIWAEKSKDLKFREFVIFEPGNAYPEYLIYYQRKSCDYVGSVNSEGFDGERKEV